MNNKLQVILLFLFIWPCTAFSQSYTVKEIKEKSGKTLTKLTGKSISAACVYDSNSYYSYVANANDTSWGILAQDKRTKGKLLNVYTRYFLHYTYPKCAVYSTINCSIILEFDKTMSLSTEPDLSCIPDFMLKNEACHLLSSAEAIKMAKDKYFIPSDREPNAHFWYDPKAKQFSWSIDGAYLKDTTKKNEYSTQIVTLDAETGAVISQAKF